MVKSLQRSVFLGTFVDCKSLKQLNYLKDTAVCVDENGIIVAIERECREEEQVKQSVLPRLGWEKKDVSFKKIGEGQFFFPGFIDTHIHASQYPNAGIFGQSTLLDWLNKYTFPIENSLKNLAKAKQVYTRCIQRTLSNGTTTAVYFATISVPATNILADICLAKGQRAFVGRCCMDSAINPDYYRDVSPEKSIADTRTMIDYIASIDPKNTLITPIITPRFAPSCSSEMMRGLGSLQRETGLPMQTHISESQREIDLVRKLFPQCANYTDVYDQHGLLSKKTILAHAIHLTEVEADIIKLRQSKISHCPISNTHLSSGVARIRWLLNKGVDIGLGTDLSGGYSSSILEVARQAIMVSRHVAMDGDDEAMLSVEEALYLATRGGAKVVGLENKVGAFQVGMKWDAQLIGLSWVSDGEPLVEEEGMVDIFCWDETKHHLTKWFFNGDDRNTLAVWIGGHLVHQRKRYQGTA